MIGRLPVAPKSTLTVLSWNLGRLNESMFAEFVHHVEANTPWDILLLQEVGKFPAEVLMLLPGNHMLYIQKSAPNSWSTGVIVKAPWVIAIRKFGSLGRSAYVDLRIANRPIRCITSHLNPSYKSDIDKIKYEDQLSKLETLKRGKRWTHIVGVDANAVLGEQPNSFEAGFLPETY